jgi:hypothetical protein
MFRAYFTLFGVYLPPEKNVEILAIRSLYIMCHIYEKNLLRNLTLIWSKQSEKNIIGIYKLKFRKSKIYVWMELCAI